LVNLKNKKKLLYYFESYSSLGYDRFCVSPCVSVLVFIKVKTLIMLMLFLKQARGRPTWSLRAT